MSEQTRRVLGWVSKKVGQRKEEPSDEGRGTNFTNSTASKPFSFGDAVMNTNLANNSWEGTWEEEEDIDL